MVLRIDDVDAGDVRIVLGGDGGDLFGLAKQSDIGKTLLTDDGGGLDGALLLTLGEQDVLLVGFGFGFDAFDQ